MGHTLGGAQAQHTAHPISPGVGGPHAPPQESTGVANAPGGARERCAVPGEGHHVCWHDPSPQALPLLSESDLVRTLGQEGMEELLSSATLRTYAAGQLLFTPDDHGEVLFLVKSGCVHIYCLSSTGRKLVLGEFCAGTIVGLLALVGQGTYSIFAETVEPCLFCLLPTERLRLLAQQNVELAWQLVQVAGEGLRRSMTHLEETAFKTVRARLAAVLVTLSEQHGPRLDGYTHEGLAERVGTYRETVSALLGELRRGGVLALEPGRLEILDVEVLRDMSMQREERRGLPHRWLVQAAP